LLASKYDELDKRIPYIKEIRVASSRAEKYSKQQFLDMQEFFVKEILNWDFCAITTLHFTYNLISQGILFEDDSFPKTHSQTRVLKSLRK
jgi:hypothetical protein